MGFLTPAYLGLAALAIPIVILYMLRLRRREVLVSSTFLWQLVVRDREANAPWQRLKRNLLLLLQLVILAALVLALARPWIPSATVAQGNLVVLLDASASMAATDVQPSRFGAAQGVVRGLIDALGVQDSMTLIAVGPQPRVLASQSVDKNALSTALAGAQASQAPADWSAAFALAIAQARHTQSPTTVIVGDGGLPDDLPPLPGDVRFVRVGSSGDNLAITALAARPQPGGAQLFVGLSNSGDKDMDSVVDVAVASEDQAPQLFNAQNVRVPARGTASVLMTLPQAAQIVRAHLSNGGALPLDDQAWAVVPQQSAGKVLLLTRGNVFLEKGLALLPGVATFRADPAQPLPSQPFDVTILDGVLPAGGSLPPGDLLMINPPSSTQLLELGGVFTNTRITQVATENPIMRYVDTGNLHVRQARGIRIPPWATPLLLAQGGPLLIAGQEGSRQVAVLTFDLHDSDLPLQIAFPILLTNLMQWYAPAQMFSAPSGLAPGEPLALRPPAGASDVSVQKPDGTLWRVPASEGGVTFAETEQLGLYVVQGAGTGATQRQYFAVNLFSPDESNIRPRESIVIGTAPVSAAPSQTVGQREIWPWLAAAALAVLAVEWWVFHRGATLPQARPRIIEGDKA